MYSQKHLLNLKFLTITLFFANRLQLKLIPSHQGILKF